MDCIIVKERRHGVVMPSLLIKMLGPSTKDSMPHLLTRLLPRISKGLTPSHWSRTNLINGQVRLTRMSPSDGAPLGDSQIVPSDGEAAQPNIISFVRMKRRIRRSRSGTTREESLLHCWFRCRGEVTSVNHWRPFTLSGVNLIY